jgi:hypothetical protein
MTKDCTPIFVATRQCCLCERHPVVLTRGSGCLARATRAARRPLRSDAVRRNRRPPRFPRDAARDDRWASQRYWRGRPREGLSRIGCRGPFRDDAPLVRRVPQLTPSCSPAECFRTRCSPTASGQDCQGRCTSGQTSTCRRTMAESVLARPRSMRCQSRVHAAAELRRESCYKTSAEFVALYATTND